MEPSVNFTLCELRALLAELQKIVDHTTGDNKEYLVEKIEQLTELKREKIHDLLRQLP